MANRTVHSIISLSCVLIALTAIIEASVEDAQARKPLFSLNLGPFKLAIDFKETSNIDKLKISKLSLRYLIGLDGQEANTVMFKQSFREDLVRCENLLNETPEMDSLIDCKPLNWHLPERNLIAVNDAARPDNYVRRFIFASELNDDLPFLSDTRQDHQFYPLKADHTEQAIDVILAKHNMTQPPDLGFCPMSTKSGFFVKSKIANSKSQVTCSANLFIFANRTEPMSIYDSELHGHPELLARLGLATIEFMINGALFSVQDASCSTGKILELDTDFTLIYRKQFPYITCRHNMKLKPLESLFNYHGKIDQFRDESSPDSYNTSIEIKSLSAIFKSLNLKLNQDFVNLDSDSGFELMTLYHSLQSLTVRGVWNADSMEKHLNGFTSSIMADVINETRDSLGEPNFILTYADKPELSQVTFTLGINRKILHSFLRRFGFASKQGGTGKSATYTNPFNSLMPELQAQLKGLVDDALERDEL